MMMKFSLVPAILMLCYVSQSNADEYIGCYLDKADRILEGGRFVSSDMTIEKCVHDCTLQNYLFAGLEFGNQCYCGNNLEKYETKADSECSTNCAGDASQKCGATWRISVYSTKSNYLGCFEDKPARILEGSVITTSTMTTKKCLADCKAAGKRFALTQHSDQCFCGNHLKRYNKKLDHLCDYSCAGNSNEKCGGLWHGSLYAVVV